MTETETLMAEQHVKCCNCDTCAYGAGRSKCSHHCVDCMHRNEANTCLCFLNDNPENCSYYEEENV